MFKNLLSSFLALDFLRKKIIFFATVVALIGGGLTAKSIFFAIHDAKIATVERERISEESQKQEKKTNDKINEFLAVNSSATGDNVFIERVFPQNKASRGAKKIYDEKLSRESSNADAGGAELSGDNKDSKLGDADELCTTDIHQCGFSELLQAYREEFEKQKPLCYPVDIEKDDGTTEISEICY